MPGSENQSPSSAKRFGTLDPNYSKPSYKIVAWISLKYSTIDFYIKTSICLYTEVYDSTYSIFHRISVFFSSKLGTSQ